MNVCMYYVHIDISKRLKYIYRMSQKRIHTSVWKKKAPYIIYWRSKFCVHRKEGLWPVSKQDDYSRGSSLTFRHSSIQRSGKRQARCVMGWLHTTLQLLPVTLSVVLSLYDTLHPSAPPPPATTSESQKGLNQVSVGGIQHFLFTISNRPGKV
jgi:hypothetical protein